MRGAMRGSLDMRAAVWLHSLCTGSAHTLEQALCRASRLPWQAACNSTTHARSSVAQLAPERSRRPTPASHHVFEESFFFIVFARFQSGEEEMHMEALLDFDASPPPPLETRPVRFGAWVRPAGWPAFLALTVRPRAAEPAGACRASRTTNGWPCSACLLYTSPSPRD